MPRNNCEYCGVPLTHDSLSVRRAHNGGRNHIKNVVDYYELAAKEVGLLPANFPSSTDPFNTQPIPDTHDPLNQTPDLERINHGAPGLEPRNKANALEAVQARPVLPFPKHIASLPPPPPPFYQRR